MARYFAHPTARYFVHPTARQGLKPLANSESPLKWTRGREKPGFFKKPGFCGFSVGFNRLSLLDRGFNPCRDIGILGYWAIGLLGYWDIGLLGYWAVGLLGYWAIGLLGCKRSH